MLINGRNIFMYAPFIYSFLLNISFVFFTIYTVRDIYEMSINSIYFVISKDKR